jgi:4-hydroxy-3-methylbut-2-enyl diphosphate reductase IspH
MTKADEKQIQTFLQQLMEIERRYGNELKNARTNRQEEVRELVDKFAIVEDTDGN